MQDIFPLQIEDGKEKRKLDGMESSKSKSNVTLTACTDDMRDAHNLSHAMWCAMSEDDDARLNKTNKNTTCTLTCQVSRFVFTVLVLDVTLSLVSDVLSFGFTTHT